MNIPSLRFYFVFMVIVISCTLLTTAPIDAAPSSALQRAIGTTLRAQAATSSLSEGELDRRLSSVLTAVHRAGVKVPNLAIELEAGKPAPRVLVEIPAGTLSKQLDSIAEAANYVWQANGEWINFIPKTRMQDDSYVMNWRIPGKIILSRDLNKTSSVHDWFIANHITITRLVRSFRYVETTPDGKEVEPVKQLGPDPIVLQDPTLREFYNARETLWGHSRWVITVTSPQGPEAPAAGVHLDIWGDKVWP